MIGSTVLHYKVTAKLGEGGMGEVSVPGLSFPDYDVSADGQRFVMFSGGANDLGSSTVSIVIGWFTELRRLTNSEDE